MPVRFQRDQPRGGKLQLRPFDYLDGVPSRIQTFTEDVIPVSVRKFQHLFLSVHKHGQKGVSVSLSRIRAVHRRGKRGALKRSFESRRRIIEHHGAFLFIRIIAPVPVHIRGGKKCAARNLPDRQSAFRLSPAAAARRKEKDGAQAGGNISVRFHKTILLIQKFSRKDGIRARIYWIGRTSLSFSSYMPPPNFTFTSPPATFSSVSASRV